LVPLMQEAELCIDTLSRNARICMMPLVACP
jgi:hypothetical protein